MKHAITETCLTIASILFWIVGLTIATFVAALEFVLDGSSRSPRSAFRLPRP